MAELPFSSFRMSGNLIFFSGKIELTPEGKLLKGTITEKTRQVMENIKTQLKSAGLGIENIVYCQIFLTDMKNYAEMNEEYVKHLKKPYPARFAVAVKELPLGAKIEIAVVASNE
jgi:2-iminobutanoate/2-iminopropanoate deaminase